MDKKAFVLLSGGLDSTTALYLALSQYPMAEAVSINYGQRHSREIDFAGAICHNLGIQHTTLDVGTLLSGVGVMLTSPEIEVPNISYSDIHGVSPTYVPFRNGLMLSAIAAHAQKYVNQQIEAFVDVEADRKAVGTHLAKDLCGIYAGMHADDAHNFAYPDCTPEFLGAMSNAISVGTYYTVRLHAPFMSLDKSQIVEWGTKLGVPYENTWSCYKGGDLHCGTCPTCRSRKEAFAKASVKDPTEYAV